jgi:hypothetical protein
VPRLMLAELVTHNCRTPGCPGEAKTNGSLCRTCRSLLRLLLTRAREEERVRRSPEPRRAAPAQARNLSRSRPAKRSRFASVQGPCREFDWDEALRLRVDGWTFAAIGAKFGVSRQAVHRACGYFDRHPEAWIHAMLGDELYDGLEQFAIENGRSVVAEFNVALDEHVRMNRAELRPLRA